MTTFAPDRPALRAWLALALFGPASFGAAAIGGLGVAGAREEYQRTGWRWPRSS